MGVYMIIISVNIMFLLKVLFYVWFQHFTELQQRIHETYKVFCLE